MTGRTGPWAIARRIRITTIRGTAHWAYTYWTGQALRTTPEPGSAYRFESSNAARQCANTHAAFKDSDDWYVVPIEGKSLAHKEIA